MAKFSEQMQSIFDRYTEEVDSSYASGLNRGFSSCVFHGNSRKGHGRVLGELREGRARVAGEFGFGDWNHRLDARRAFFDFGPERTPFDGVTGTFGP